MKKKIQKQRRKTRIRSKIKGTQNKPRLSVARSNLYIYAQLIDDENKKTILGFSEKNLSLKKKITKTEKARQLGFFLAKKAVEKKINSVIFDKGSYAYHGRIKALAEGAREGGLKF